jgi:hypothetical protein
MKTALVDRIPFTKIVTVLAICAGVAVGLCGVGLAIGFGTKFSGSGTGGLAMNLFLICGLCWQLLRLPRIDDCDPKAHGLCCFR